MAAARRAPRRPTYSARKVEDGARSLERGPSGKSCPSRRPRFGATRGRFGQVLGSDMRGLKEARAGGGGEFWGSDLLVPVSQLFVLQPLLSPPPLRHAITPVEEQIPSRRASPCRRSQPWRQRTGGGLWPSWCACRPMRGGTTAAPSSPSPPGCFTRLRAIRRRQASPPVVRGRAWGSCSLRALAFSRERAGVRFFMPSCLLVAVSVQHASTPRCMCQSMRSQYAGLADGHPETSSAQSLGPTTLEFGPSMYQLGQDWRPEFGRSG